MQAIGQGQGVDAESVGEAARAVAALRQQLQEMQQGQVRASGHVQQALAEGMWRLWLPCAGAF